MHRFLLLWCLLWAPSAFASPFTPVTGVVGAAAGEFHSCVVLVDGTVECFGLNEHGQLGDGTTRHRVTAGPVSALDDAIRVVAGAAHACALRAGGTVACWGRNESGQLGDGSTDDALTPVAVTGLTGVTQLTAGANHTCAIATGGTAWCWGANAAGQLGDGTTDPRPSPTPVAAPLAQVRHIDAGGAHTCAVTDGGAVFCWGDNGEGQLGTGGAATPSTTPVALNALTGGVEEVAAGTTHACARRDDGSVACWGRNADGEAGGAPSAPRTTPVTVDGVQGVAAITAGRAYTCALGNDAAVSCWGAIDSNGIPLAGIAAIDATHGHLCATLLDGQARCWGGSQFYGERGTGYARVRLDAVAVRENTAQVEAGTSFVCALDTSGFVRCWGGNNDGLVLGRDVYYLAEPRLVPQLAEVTALSVSEYHACASNGPVATCWGGLGYGEVGRDVWVPVPEPGPPVAGIAPIESLRTGAHHTCAVTDAGAAACWGEAAIGDGSVNRAYAPIIVSGLSSGVRQVAGGAGHRCALLDDGTVKCWGHLHSSPGTPNPAIGNGSGQSQLTPVTVAGLQGVTALAAGRMHTCALLDTGRLRCWGANTIGQLGDGTTTDRFVPVDVPGLENVAAIHAGVNTTCAVLDDASAVCWGNGANGQLGNGKRASSAVPVPVTVWDAPIADFAFGEDFACAASTSGSLRCWGANHFLQLGEAGMQGAYGRTVQRSPAPYRVFGGGFESD